MCVCLFCSDAFFRRCKQGVLQYVLIKPLVSVLVVIFTLTKLYKIDTTIAAGCDENVY